jgi:hypothetical protein
MQRLGLALLVSLTLAIGLSFQSGCGDGQQRGATDASPSPGDSVERVAADLPPLPDWAPENPSAEFLRAARVLKPAPTDELTRGDLPDEIRIIIVELKRRADPILWELFGSLSDEQIERFRETERVAMSVRDMTPRQLEILNAFLDANKGLEAQVEGQPIPDLRVGLYKAGAHEDLSNVDVRFGIEGADMLTFVCEVEGKEDVLRWTGWAQL